MLINSLTNDLTIFSKQYNPQKTFSKHVAANNLIVAMKKNKNLRVERDELVLHRHEVLIVFPSQIVKHGKGKERTGK